ncbi:MAG: hypothetical protein U1F43_05175 [Myxococcota bacterium]
MGGGIGALPRRAARRWRATPRSKALVANVIQKGLSMPEPKKAGVLDPNILLRNAAQWIQAGEAKVTVLSPTDEQDQRARHLKETATPPSTPACSGRARAAPTPRARTPTSRW